MSIDAITVSRSLVATSSRSRSPSFAAIALKARASGTNSAGSRLRAARADQSPWPKRFAIAAMISIGLDDELLGGDQRAEQHEQADEAELQIGGANVVIDRGRHLGFVDADDQARLRAGNAREVDDAFRAVGRDEGERSIRLF